MSRDQRNARVLQTSHIAEHITAQAVTDGVAQLSAERVKALEDGPDKGESAGRSNSTTSTTERNAAEAYRLGLLIEDLRDAVLGFEIAHRHLLTLANEAKKTRAFTAPLRPGQIDPDDPPPVLPICRDQQKGREGAIVWGDPMCLYSSVKAGLCQRHYSAWYRYRQANGIRTDRDFEPGSEVA